MKEIYEQVEINIDIFEEDLDIITTSFNEQHDNTYVNVDDIFGNDDLPTDWDALMLD